jgi:hypothetical protein
MESSVVLSLRFCIHRTGDNTFTISQQICDAIFLKDKFFLFCFVLLSGGIGVWIQGLTLTKQALDHFSHTSSAFCSGYFEDGGVSQSIFLDWPWTTILPISVSQVARITGASPRSLAKTQHFYVPQRKKKLYQLKCFLTLLIIRYTLDFTDLNV